ncbi:MAG: hypothetical protein ACOYT4_02725 [Nanoarchaeota archaeon]
MEALKEKPEIKEEYLEDRNPKQGDFILKFQKRQKKSKEKAMFGFFDKFVDYHTVGISDNQKHKCFLSYDIGTIVESIPMRGTYIPDDKDRYLDSLESFSCYKVPTKILIESGIVDSKKIPNVRYPGNLEPSEYMDRIYLFSPIAHISAGESSWYVGEEEMIKVLKEKKEFSDYIEKFERMIAFIQS